MITYLDCNATTPVEPEVAEELLRYTQEEFGNAGSRSHEYGSRARQRIEQAREQIALVVAADSADVIFTSGATEANNIALLGLERFGRDSDRMHIVSTQIEHKAVLEPLEELARRGFDIELVPPGKDGVVDAAALATRVDERTLLVSLMHVNNETGVIQPVAELADLLADSDAYLHVDAAQGFGKDLEPLRDPRVDLISASAHKLYGPKGVGALITRRRAGRRPPLAPLQYGGGQERGLRPGTLPVGLCAAWGLAAEIALRDHRDRLDSARAIRTGALKFIADLGGQINGDPERTVATTVNVSFPGLDSEAAMVALKGTAAVSNGSACTSHSYGPSHVLLAMGLTEERAASALRLSWSHLGEAPDWSAISAPLESFVAEPHR